MNWLNLRTEQLRSPTVAQASHEALATWLRVITYCCEQENGGRITGAAQWGDRAWMVACGVSALEVAGATPLLSREGEDILVSMYPLDKQKEVAKDRLNGKRGGRCKTQAKTQASRQNGTQGGRPEKPKPLPENNPSQNPTERKEKGIGKEVEGNEKNSAADPPWKVFEDEWNKLPEPFPRISHMNDSRKAALKTRLSEQFWDSNWRGALSKLPTIPWMKGENDRGWIADPDWFLQPGKVEKIIEHVNKTPNPNGHRSQPHPDRNAGTLNAGQSAQYRGAGRILPPSQG